MTHHLEPLIAAGLQQAADDTARDEKHGPGFGEDDLPMSYDQAALIDNAEHVITYSRGRPARPKRVQIEMDDGTIWIGEIGQNPTWHVQKEITT